MEKASPPEPLGQCHQGHAQPPIPLPFASPPQRHCPSVQSSTSGRKLEGWQACTARPKGNISIHVKDDEIDEIL